MTGVRLVETTPGVRRVAVMRTGWTLILSPDCTVELVHSEHVGNECSLVDLIGSIGTTLRMPLPCMLYTDCRRRSEHRYVCRIDRWFLGRRSGDFGRIGDKRFEVVHFGPDGESAAVAALQYAREHLTPPGVRWVPVTFWRSRREDEHWCKHALREALRAQKFGVTAW